MKRIYQTVISWIKSLFLKKKRIHTNPIVTKKRVMKGLKVWEADLTTGDVVPAEMEITISFDTNGKSRRNRKVLIKKNCIYEYALNGENACRKLETRIANIIQASK